MIGLSQSKNNLVSLDLAYFPNKQNRLSVTVRGWGKLQCSLERINNNIIRLSLAVKQLLLYIYIYIAALLPALLPAYVSYFLFNLCQDRLYNYAALRLSDLPRPQYCAESPAADGSA